MTTAASARPSLRAAPGTASPSQQHVLYSVPVGWVKLGMFVAELDRPWLGTPFMMQGFLVSTPRQIEVLAQYCQRVLVEPDASLPDVVPLVLERGELVVVDQEKPSRQGETGSIRPPEPDRNSTASGRDANHTPVAPRPAAPQAGSKATSPAARARTAAATAHSRKESPHAGADRSSPTPASVSPRQLGPETQGPTRGGALMRWIRRLLGPDRASAPDTPRLPRELEDEIRACLPADARLQDWPEKRSVQSEIPRARTALLLAEEKLSGVFEDLRSGKLPAIESVSVAMDHVVASMIDNPNALLWVTHLRQMNARSYQHSLSVAIHMVALGRHLGFPRAQLVEIGMLGLLADIGNVKVPPALFERSGALTPDEFDAIKAHVQHSLDLLADSEAVPQEVRKGIAQHHERMDGSGYPAGLKGPEINIYGRIAGIADSFVALTAKRPYAYAITPHQALMTLFDRSQRAFHSPLVEQFVQSIGVFPVGSLVELSTSEVAVVLAHNRVRRLEPRVLLLMSPDKKLLPEPIELDLLNQPAETEKERIYILRGLPAGAYGLSPREYYADSGNQANCDA